MAKDKKKCFVLQFRLETESWQDDLLNKRFEASRKIYNALVSESLRRWNELKKTKQYRNLIKSLNHDKKHDKPIWEEVRQMRKGAGLTEYGIVNMVPPIRKYWSHLIDADTAQAIAKNVWRAWNEYFHGNGRKIHFKKYGQLTSLSGQSNRQGIRFRAKDGVYQLYWSGLKIPVLVDEANPYEVEVLSMPFAYSRIVRKYIRNKVKYYLQAVFKGEKPAKRRKSDGSFVHALGKGDVGIDIGTSTVAYSSESEVRDEELAGKAQGMEREKHILQRKLDRSRRATNQGNFNEDGTAKKGRRHWVRSKRYLKTLFKLKEIIRKQAAVRKLQHEILANHIISLGDKFYIEQMEFKALQKKAKKTEISEKTGRFKRKKRFGKSLANRAPSMFVEILKRKLGYFSKELVEIDTRKARASQFNHVTGEYHKKELSKRWNVINGRKVQRDMYSAFLIMNISEDLKTFDLEKCNSRFENFLDLHDKEVERLSYKKNLSCIGI